MLHYMTIAENNGVTRSLQAPHLASFFLVSFALFNDTAFRVCVVWNLESTVNDNPINWPNSIGLHSISNRNICTVRMVNGIKYSYTFSILFYLPEQSTSFFTTSSSCMLLVYTVRRTDWRRREDKCITYGLKWLTTDYFTTM